MKTPLLPTTTNPLNADSNSMTSLASQWINRFLKVAVVIGVGIVIIQIGVTFWLRS